MAWHPRQRIIENADILGQTSCPRARIPAGAGFPIPSGNLASIIFEVQLRRVRRAEEEGCLIPIHPGAGQSNSKRGREPAACEVVARLTEEHLGLQ